MLVRPAIGRQALGRTKDRTPPLPMRKLSRTLSGAELAGSAEMAADKAATIERVVLRMFTSPHKPGPSLPLVTGSSTGTSIETGPLLIGPSDALVDLPPFLPPLPSSSSSAVSPPSPLSPNWSTNWSMKSPVPGPAEDDHQSDRAEDQFDAANRGRDRRRRRFGTAALVVDATAIDRRAAGIAGRPPKVTALKKSAPETVVPSDFFWLP